MLKLKDFKTMTIKSDTSYEIKGGVNTSYGDVGGGTSGSDYRDGDGHSHMTSGPLDGWKD